FDGNDWKLKSGSGRRPAGRQRRSVTRARFPLGCFDARWRTDPRGCIGWTPQPSSRGTCLELQRRVRYGPTSVSARPARDPRRLPTRLRSNRLPVPGDFTTAARARPATPEHLPQAGGEPEPRQELPAAGAHRTRSKQAQEEGNQDPVEQSAAEKTAPEIAHIIPQCLTPG